MRILLVEDDERIARDVASALSGNGYIVDRAGNGIDAQFLGDTEDYAAAILDLGLPQLDGLSVLKRWRQNGRAMPVLILTARDTWMERVEGIDAGADDYLPKPFHIAEMLARLRALVRRSAGQPAPVLSVGTLVLDTRLMTVSENGRPLSLTPQEYRLLSYLMHHAGRVVPHSQLLDQLYSDSVEKDSNAIEVLVGRVRRKLEKNPIETRRGFGYLIPRPEP